MVPVKVTVVAAAAISPMALSRLVTALTLYQAAKLTGH